MNMNATSEELDSVDLSDIELFRHGFPHGVFTALREQAPVWRHPETPGTREIGAPPFWVVSRQADIEAISRDHAHFRSFEGPMVQGWDPMAQGQMLITMDPPDHTRLRRLVNAGFTPRMTAMLEEQARGWAIQIVERALDKGECNFVQEVAYQLPMHMIADIVGIPKSDRASLFTIIQESIEAIEPRPGTAQGGAGGAPQALVGEMFAYAHELAEAKRRSPGRRRLDHAHHRRGRATPDGSTSRLNEFELDLFFMVLTIAGSETTRDAISSARSSPCCRTPTSWNCCAPTLSVMDTAVDEIVRWASPVDVLPSHGCRGRRPPRHEDRSRRPGLPLVSVRQPRRRRLRRTRSPSTSGGRRTRMWASADTGCTTASGPTWRGARSA